MIEFNRCSYAYGRATPALTDVTATIRSRATVMLGPNGAGKSTLMKLVAGVMRPRPGMVRVDGIDATDARRRRDLLGMVSWLPQSVPVAPGLTVRESVAYAAWMRGVPRGRAWVEALAALGRVGLDDRPDLLASALSGGQVRRLGIAQCLVHGPRVVLLDEPTAGLDPQERARLREVLAGLDDVQVVVSTHQTEDLAEVYDEVVVLHRGTVRWQGPVEGFLALGGGDPRDVRGAAERSYLAVVGGER